MAGWAYGVGFEWAGHKCASMPMCLSGRVMGVGTG